MVAPCRGAANGCPVSHAKGDYACLGCGAELFSSRAEFDSRIGWPSFCRPVAADRLDTAPDCAMGEARAEVMCHDCGDYLGRAFSNGPPPTGLRFRLISAAPKFVGEPTRPLKQPDRVLNGYLE